MKLNEIFIKRPIFTIVINLLLVSIGAILFTKLETRNNPNISLPYVTVSTFCPNASAEFVEKKITQYLENELKTLPNLESISSISSGRYSEIKLAFQFSSNIDNALNNVRAKIFNASNNLPEESKVSVERVDIDANASMYLSISSDKYDDLALTQIIRKELSDPLSRLETVGKVNILGGHYYTMQIYPIATKMIQYQLTPADIVNAVKKQNNDYAIGQVKDDVNDFSIKLNSTLSSIYQFKEIIVKTFGDGTIIKLGNIADVELKAQENTGIIKHNQKKVLLLALIKASDASVIDLSKKVQSTIQKIQATSLPSDINISTFYDASDAVKSAINAVYKTIFESIIFVGIITFLFFGSFKITIIPLVAIPISLIATFSAMHLFGFSINTFTLLAMVLATGLVVDDAMVMLENIERHNFALKKAIMQAALDGSKEIYLAIIAMTLTLSAVFLPVGFLDNFIGKLLIEFAWTLAFCVLFSGIVSLTLTPLMCAKIINDNKSHSKQIKFLEGFNKFIIWLQKTYGAYLKIALNNKKKLYFIGLISTAILIFSFINVKKTFGPVEDQGALLVNFQGPKGLSLDDTCSATLEAEKIFASIKEIKKYLTVITERNKNTAFGIVVLQDWSNRKKSQDQIRTKINKKLESILDMSIFARNYPSLTNRGGDDNSGDASSIEFHLLSSLEYKELNEVARNIIRKMSLEGEVFDINSIYPDFRIGYAALELIVNKEKAAKYNLDIKDIATTIQLLMGGKEIGDFTIGSEIYKVNMQYKLKDRNKIENLRQICIKNSKNAFVPLESVAQVMEASEARNYNRYNNLRSIKITASLTNKADKKQAKSIINSIASSQIDPNTTKLEFMETETKELAKSTISTFCFALLFIFLVLSAQFESFLSAGLILMAVPFSIVGAILALLVFKDSLNLYSGIGLITLIGLITKNSIMIVEFANQLVRQGLSIQGAVIEAAQLRLRPILMTALSTICGALPLIFTTGASSGACRSIGLTIVGGMTVGTLFTSFIIPALYSTFTKAPKDKFLRKDEA